MRQMQFAMRPARAVQRTKRVGDLSRVFQCLIDREWPLLQAFGEQLAFEVLKSEITKAVFFATPVIRADVRVMQPLEHGRFLCERQLRESYLQRDAIQL